MNRQNQIAERRKQIPKKYRGIYNKALRRGNLRAAINAQCLQCVGWVSDEVRKCTDLACPLYVHRQLNGEYCAVQTDQNNQMRDEKSTKAERTVVGVRAN